MKLILALAAAMTLAGAAAAQPSGPPPTGPSSPPPVNTPSHMPMDQRHMDRNRMGSVADRHAGHMVSAGYRHHHRHRVCVWRHHHRVCRWR